MSSPNPEMRRIRRTVRHHLLLMVSGAEPFDPKRVDDLLDEVVRAAREGGGGVRHLIAQRERWVREALELRETLEQLTGGEDER